MGRKDVHEKDISIEVANSPVEEDTDGATDNAKDGSSRKRKREALAEELAIDVSLPEPPSKKALRKAKKSKPSNPTRESADSADISTNVEEEARPKLSRSKDEKDGKDRRTEHSIWIGNLPWTASKDEVRDFICSSASLAPSQIVRLHLPAPAGAKDKNPRDLRKFLNKGFAYVDFDSQESLFAALQITETAFGTSGRNVLVKSAKSFEGRPEDHVAKAVETQKPVSKRVFVGNLAFETAKEDLREHYGQCGEIESIHMATFEDSGNCKGYAWVTFANVEASAAAVKGFIVKQAEPRPGDSESEDPPPLKRVPPSATQGFTEEELDTNSEAQQIVQERLRQQARKAQREERGEKVDKVKGRKWYVNRLQGRELRCEFAEDDTTRYKKRFGSGTKKADGEADGIEFGGDRAKRAGNGEEASFKHEKTSHDRRKEARRAAKNEFARSKIDARTIKPGAALAHAPKASAAIVGAKGKKITFE